MVFIQCVAMSMAELCSSMPTSVCLYQLSVLIAGWSLLRRCRTCSTGMGPIGRLAYGLVQLYCSSNGSSICRLWYRQLIPESNV